MNPNKSRVQQLTDALLKTQFDQKKYAQTARDLRHDKIPAEKIKDLPMTKMKDLKDNKYPNVIV